MPSWADLAPKAKPEPTTSEMDRLCAQTFGRGVGRDLLEKLRDLYIDKVLPGTASESQLRDLNAQRQLVRLLEASTERGSKAIKAKT